MTALKICGIYREEDCHFMEEIRPDYVGFILGVEKSHRNVEQETLRKLVSLLPKEIRKVGVFVNPTLNFLETVADKLDVLQLLGQETEETIALIRNAFPEKKIWKAFQIKSLEDVKLAETSSADLVVLDGAGGAGVPFDWSLISHFSRDFALAGGITPENVSEAVAVCQPQVIDLSSGVETEKKKDIVKLRKLNKEMRK